MNCHIHTSDDRKLALFASFFRVGKGPDELAGKVVHIHSLTWAVSDLVAGKYYAESRVDRNADTMALERLDRSDGTKDPLLRRAMREIYEKGNVPLPDRKFEGVVRVATDQLDLEFDGVRFFKKDDDSYELHLHNESGTIGCKLVFTPRKPPCRHGNNGVIPGTEGEKVFHYFIPRCEVTGSVTLNEIDSKISHGEGWYIHEFGRLPYRDQGESTLGDVMLSRVSVQLADGTDVSAYSLSEVEKGSTVGQFVVFSDSEGTQETYEEFDFLLIDSWRSTRTFNEYPIRWRLCVPAKGLDLELEAHFPEQEFITLVSKPSFWGGRVSAGGTLMDHPVAGHGWVESSGSIVVNNLQDFFSAVGKEVRKSVRMILPSNPTYEDVRAVIASEQRDHYMNGVNLDVFAATITAPIREILDRGGKAWRSYAALACCDIVGGDSRRFVQWTAIAELMHVGSLIIDDVEDQSDIRRGDKACHMIYGEPIAINAGTICYLLGQKRMAATDLSSEDKCRIYELYFEALRAGHAGQAFDIYGLDHLMPGVVETAECEELERHLLAIERFKCGAPASALARMGAIAGGGTEEQIEAVGRFFESLGTAFQIIDDVLNLRGFENNLKRCGEDISHGKVTMPLAKAMGLLPLDQRRWLWDNVRCKPTDPVTVESCIEMMERCGAIEASVTHARALVEDGWQTLEPRVEDSLAKLMLRSFGWYVLERHY